MLVSIGLFVCSEMHKQRAIEPPKCECWNSLLCAQLILHSLCGQRGMGGGNRPSYCPNLSCCEYVAASILSYPNLRKSASWFRDTLQLNEFCNLLSFPRNPSSWDDTDWQTMRGSRIGLRKQTVWIQPTMNRLRSKWSTWEQHCITFLRNRHANFDHIHRISWLAIQKLHEFVAIFAMNLPR